MGPLVGALVSFGANSLSGGGAAGGFFNGLFSSLMNGSGGGLFGMLNNLFCGCLQSKGNEQAHQLLGDIKDMLGELIDQKGDGCGVKPHDCGGAEKPHDCGGSEKPPHCGGADESGWDGKDKSRSLDRERGATRLLDQAKDTHDPEEKRELIKMALEMLQEGEDGCGCDGNSYDKDIVAQAEKMLDKIDDSCLSDCAKSKAMDNVIDMLEEDGGVDGKPVDDGCDDHDSGWSHHHFYARPLPIYHPH